MSVDDARPVSVRTLAQLYAISLDRWTEAELDYHSKLAILRRLPVEALRAIAEAESETEALELFTFYGG